MKVEPFFKQEVLERYSKKKLGKRELLETLYDEWLKTESKEIFLILYMQTWLTLDDRYMEDVEKFYQEKFYEKDLFFELLDYGKRHLDKDIKFLLLTGHIYSATSHYFWMEMAEECLEEKGRKITESLAVSYPESFMIHYFYMSFADSDKEYVRWRKNSIVK